MAMTVKDILLVFLQMNGFDGLYNDAGDCACDLEDLMPCESCAGECKLGYYVPEKLWPEGTKEEGDTFMIGGEKHDCEGS